MDRVEEIEAAIEGLQPEEYRRVVEWLLVREGQRWDEQMDRDSSSGKLDFLFDEAEGESTKVDHAIRYFAVRAKGIGIDGVRR